MRYSKAAFMLFILGIVLIGASTFFGKGKIMLIFFIPVFYATGILAFIGMGCIIVSMFLMFYSMTQTLGVEEEYAPVKQERKVKGGGIVFIGPVPIIFGSDVKTAVILMILADALMMGVFLFLIIMFK